jgi:hypothetical protein
MSGTLSTPLLPSAGFVAVLPPATVVRRPTSAPRLVVEAFITALAVIGALWLGWDVLSLLEQRW